MALGGQRLVGAVDWSQQGRSFDALRLSAEGDVFRVDALGVVLANDLTTTFDADAHLLGVYGQIKQLGLGQGRIAKLLLDMHQPLFSFTEKVYGGRAAMFPDPLTMAYVVDPAISRQVRTADLKMELCGSPRRGASLEQPGERVTLIPEIDKAGFESILLGIRNLA